MLVTQSIDSTIDIVTPENIAFQYEVAGPFRRLPAFLIDLSVRGGIWVTMLVIFVVLGLAIGGINLAAIGITAWLVSWFVLEWFYGGLLETFWNGQTVGKRVCHLRVLQIDGQPINGMQAVMRNILRLVDMMPLIPLGVLFSGEESMLLPTCLIGIVTTLMNRRYQRLGDMACGTMVVVEQRWQYANDAKRMRYDDIERLALQIPDNFVPSRKLSDALGAYVERRSFLLPARRAEIASHLAPLLATQVNLSKDDGLDDDQLLCALYYHVFVTKPTASEIHKKGKNKAPLHPAATEPTS